MYTCSRRLRFLQGLALLNNAQGGGRQGEEAVLFCFVFSLPPPFSEDYRHMTAAQHNAENRREKKEKDSSLALVRGLTGTLTYCAQQYKQYNEYVVH